MTFARLVGIVFPGVATQLKQTVSRLPHLSKASILVAPAPLPGPYEGACPCNSTVARSLVQVRVVENTLLGDPRQSVLLVGRL